MKCGITWSGPRHTSAKMNDFLRFRSLVLSDPVLQAELRDIPDLKTLYRRVLELGRELGYSVSEQDLEEVANTNRRAWLERWLDQ